MFGLSAPPGLPVAGMVTRRAGQKGLDIVCEALDDLLGLGLTLVILGTGDQKIQDFLLDAQKKHPARLGLKIAFDERIAHTIYAGSDVFLIPSRYEPCGLTQMYAKLNTSGLRPGQFRSFGRVRITRQQFGWVELIGYWLASEDEPWYLISDRTLGRQAVRIYQRRFAIEAMFRDFKSHGWELAASRIRQPAQFERLLFILAFAYIWLVMIGVALVKRGLRRRVDRRARRTLSYFRLGWDWLKRLLAHHLPIPNYAQELDFAK